MATYRRILAASDLSERSRPAVEFALALALPLEASVDLLHAYRLPSYAPDGDLTVVPEDEATTLGRFARYRVQRRLERFQRDLWRGHKLSKLRIEQGDPTAGILRAMNEAPYDLLVVGTRGEGAWPGLRLGSVAGNVVRHAQADVLSVPPADRSGGPSWTRDDAPSIDRLLAPIDLSAESLVAARRAVELAAGLGAAVHLIHVVEPAWAFSPDVSLDAGAWCQTDVSDLQRRRERWTSRVADQLAARAGVVVSSEVSSGDPRRLVCERAADGGFDLIVMGSHGRTGSGELLFGSVAISVVRRSQVPVLTVRAPS